MHISTVGTYVELSLWIPFYVRHTLINRASTAARQHMAGIVDVGGVAAGINGSCAAAVG